MKRIKKRSKKRRRGHRTTSKASRRAQAARSEVPGDWIEAQYLHEQTIMAMAVGVAAARAARQRGTVTVNATRR